MCKKESLFESGATFVVRSRNSELWQAVLKNEDEQCRRSFVDKVGLVYVVSLYLAFWISSGFCDFVNTCT